ncbi:hypothetical protein RhiXN_04525 [Rhizoctonia solani]|nr:uncharacterized protein RhiXN_04525 [Rhizoctonia solani]KAF8681323.1 hypothetical protein RHS04_02959 [Rhizoctonia solani]QRW16524.1 hypothetical protein RhiXN_04525 [Rhizoctonia solani]
MFEGYPAITFALCTVLGTNFNLSYWSLTSRKAHQTILDLRTTNSEFYTELTSGHHPRPTASEVVDEHIILESEYVLESDDAGRGATEAIRFILNARTADEVAQPFEEGPEFEEDELAPLAVGGYIRISSQFTVTH